MKNFSNLAIPGNRIKQGQIIGYMGSTGMSTGPHLHYEVIENGKNKFTTFKTSSWKIVGWR